MVAVLISRLRIGRPKTYPTEYAHLLGALPQATAETPSSPAAALAAAQAAAAGVISGGPGSPSASAMMAAQVAAIGLPKRATEGNESFLEIHAHITIVDYLFVNASSANAWFPCRSFFVQRDLIVWLCSTSLDRILFQRKKSVS